MIFIPCYKGRILIPLSFATNCYYKLPLVNWVFSLNEHVKDLDYCLNLYLHIPNEVVCFAGYSHKPEEYSSTQDISNGVKVLALTLVKLSLQWCYLHCCFHQSTLTIAKLSLQWCCFNPVLIAVTSHIGAWCYVNVPITQNGTTNCKLVKKIIE